MKPTEEMQKLAHDFVASLFINGEGQQAERLVLTVDGLPKRDLGGWGHGTLEDRVLSLVASVAEERDRWQAKTWSETVRIVREQARREGYEEAREEAAQSVERGKPSLNRNDYAERIRALQPKEKP